MSIQQEVARRRTFAIISHPDAGKTTLTEKLLLFAGAIQIAGSVKARKASRHASSDWMEIEKQRGISVASSVMQMEYRDCVINLLDTPGHQDFSEDTYRVLTAVDAALMVIDAANGVEPQTMLSHETAKCASRSSCCPRSKGTWAWTRCRSRGRWAWAGLRRRVRHPPRPHARVPRRPGAPPDNDDFIEGLSNPEIGRRFGSAFEQASGEIELINEAAPAFDRAQFLAGKQTPVFFGSAINNFGVQEVLDALVEQAPPPGRAPRCNARCSPRNPSSPAWCSRCRPTWTPRTATASPSCA